MKSKKKRLNQRRYNYPRANEVAAVVVGEDGDVPAYRHIAIHLREQSLKTISILHAYCDPMIYPILFPEEIPSDNDFNSNEYLASE
jgi:hypothetical protein